MPRASSDGPYLSEPPEFAENFIDMDPVGTYRFNDDKNLPPKYFENYFRTIDWLIREAYERQGVKDKERVSSAVQEFMTDTRSNFTWVIENAAFTDRASIPEVISQEYLERMQSQIEGKSNQLVSIRERIELGFMRNGRVFDYEDIENETGMTFMEVDAKDALELSLFRDLRRSHLAYLMDFGTYYPYVGLALQEMADKASLEQSKLDVEGLVTDSEAKDRVLGLLKKVPLSSKHTCTAEGWNIKLDLIEEQVATLRAFREGLDEFFKTKGWEVSEK